MSHKRNLSMDQMPEVLLTGIHGSKPEIGNNLPGKAGHAPPVS